MDRERHRKRMEVFLAAVERTGDERASYLDEATQGDPDLRAEVEQLLAQEGDSTVIGSAVGNEGGSPLDSSPAYGSPVDRYEILAEIARGGTAVILRARDRNLRRHVALKKLLDTREGNPEAVRRLQREALISGRLDHPGIPAVHEIGETETGEPFIALRLVHGHTLGQLLREQEEGQLEWMRFVEIFERICQAIAYAHAHGFVHRDLKPDNVMVDEFGDVQVMDWGLAVNLEEPTEGEPEVAGGEPDESFDDFETQVGAIMGTPAYMAPEQAIGRRDKRTDVFGLGAILCRILTGKPPYVAESASEIYMLALDGDVEPAIARLRACEVDPELVELAIRCLSPEPDDRPADAGELAEAVTRFRRSVDERAEQARLATIRAEATAEEERKRRRTTLVAGGVVFGLVAILGSGAWWIRSQESKRLAILNAQLENSIGDVRSLYEDALDGDDLEETVWAQALEAGENLGELTATEVLDAALEQEADSLLAELQEAETCHLLVSDFERNRIDQLPVQLEKWVAPQQGLGGMDAVFSRHGFDPEATSPEDFAAWLQQQPPLLRGDLLSKLNEWFSLDPKADRWHTRLLEAADQDPWRVRWRRAVLDRDREFIQALVDADDTLNREPDDLIHLAFSTIRLERQGGEVVPIGLFERAQRRYPDDFDLNFWFAWFLAFSPTQLNEHYYGHLKSEDAITYSRAALASRPDVHAWFLHGEICRRAGKHVDARDALEQVVARDPDHAAAHYGLGWVYHLTEGPEKGIPHMAAAARLRPDYAVYLDGLGALYLYSEQLEKAEEILEKAVVAPNGPKTGPTYRLASVYRKQKRYEEALVLIEKAIELEPDYIDNWIELAYLRKNLKQWPELEAAARGALERAPKHPTPHELLAQALLRQGAFAEAVGHYESSIKERERLPHILAGDYFWFFAAEAALRAAALAGEEGNGREGRRLRDQARTWLGELMKRYPADGDSHPNPNLLKALREGDAFAKMRKEERLAGMDSVEAEGWRRIWAWVEAMSEKARP